MDKYEIRKYAKLGNKVLEARWSEDASKWVVKLQNVKTGEEFEDTADAIFRGVGGLNNWKWPQIPGLHDFTGKLVHSANWDPSYDYKVAFTFPWQVFPCSILTVHRAKPSP